MTNNSLDKRLFQPQCDHLTPVQVVHTNPWFKVKDRGGYFTTEYHEPQVIILPIVANYSILMVRVKRPVLNDNTIELPAGGFDFSCEKPEQGAARELFEETGVEVKDADRFNPVAPLSVSPNRMPTLVFVFQVHLSQQEYELRQHHDHEIEEVMLVTYDQAKTMILSGEIYVTVPIAIISRYLLGV